MIRSLIRASVRERIAVLAAALALAVWGAAAARRLPLDAIPDVSETQVIVETSWPGRGPDLVEAQVTRPLSAALLGAPRVRYVRGQSMSGASLVHAVFTEPTDLYFARSRVSEALSAVAATLPEGASIRLGPDATPVGWVFQYALVDASGRLAAADLRAIQDRDLRLALAAVPGVAEVASIGGAVKRLDVDVDPDRLRLHGVRLAEVVEAIRESSADEGGGVLEVAGHEHVVRSRGSIGGTADLEQVPLRPGGAGDAALRLRDVAVVSVGPDARQGIADLDGRGEVAGGIVVMRQGENALAVIDAVKRRLDEASQSLPPGVRPVVVYDRSELVRGAIATLRRTLVEEILVVSAVIVLFLLGARGALVPILCLPVAVLAAFLPMLALGVGADIMSLGGIAVAVGAMVDASIVVVENAHKRLEEWQAGGRRGARAEVVLGAMTEVGPALFFSLLVIAVSFLPVFALTGAEGRLFRPLAFTKTCAMVLAALAAVTVAPALVSLLLGRGRVRPEAASPLNRRLVAAYVPAVRFVVRRPRAVIAAAALLVLASVPALLDLGREFMPPLDEGVLLYMPTAPPGMSIAEAGRVLRHIDRELVRVPEVERVFGKAGRADTATDPAPLGMVEAVVQLRPRSAWRPGLDRDGLVADLDSRLRLPGMASVWWMPIQTRTEMLATGLRAPLGLKVFGPDLAAIERAGAAVEAALRGVAGTRGAYFERLSGGAYVDLEIDRERAARYGVRAADLALVARSAIGGIPVGETVIGNARWPIAVRYGREWREDPEALGRILVQAEGGPAVPLRHVARIAHRTGPAMLASENGRLLGFVLVDPGVRAVGDYVAEADAALAPVALPAGTRVEWTGQYEGIVRARSRLRLLVPVTIALAALLLFLNTRSVVETAIVLLAVPFSLVGAVWLMWLLGHDLSVASWVGLLALAGLDAETGVVMLLYLKIAHRSRAASGGLATAADLEEAIVDGAARRLRPKTMTVLTTMVGLLPLLWREGPGADVMQRLAVPMVGGLVSSFALELLVYPAVFALWRGRRLGETAVSSSSTAP